MVAVASSILLFVLQKGHPHSVSCWPVQPRTAIVEFVDVAYCIQLRLLLLLPVPPVKAALIWRCGGVPLVQSPTGTSTIVTVIMIMVMIIVINYVHGFKINPTIASGTMLV